MITPLSSTITGAGFGCAGTGEAAVGGGEGGTGFGAAGGDGSRRGGGEGATGLRIGPSVWEHRTEKKHGLEEEQAEEEDDG